MNATRVPATNVLIATAAVLVAAGVFPAMDGNPRSFLKSDLKEIRYEKESLMPAYAGLSAAELDNLVAYLNSLKGKR